MQKREPKTFSYESMGTRWEITIWDIISEQAFKELKETVFEKSCAFDNTYSRFIKTSLIWNIATNPGVHMVPRELTDMLKLYQKMYVPSEKKLNPLIGFTISDLGYDADYSLKEKNTVRLTPDLEDALVILDDTHIKTRQPILIDLGALGKGYFIDILWKFLTQQDINHFLINGSGDIRYQGTEPIRAGLEHPIDSSRILGSVTIKGGSLCASSTNRRTWGSRNHMINAVTLSSATDIVAVWILAKDAALADALATCLFFVSPENLQSAHTFEFYIVNKEMRVKKSSGFNVE